MILLLDHPCEYYDKIIYVLTGALTVSAQGISSLLANDFGVVFHLFSLVTDPRLVTTYVRYVASLWNMKIILLYSGRCHLQSRTTCNN